MAIEIAVSSFIPGLKTRGFHSPECKMVDTLDSLKKIAGHRDMSLQALLKLYIGQGLRQDLAKLFSSRVLEATAEVLARHIQSEEVISTIIQEIQAETNS